MPGVSLKFSYLSIRKINCPADAPYLIATDSNTSNWECYDVCPNGTLANLTTSKCDPCSDYIPNCTICSDNTTCSECEGDL